MQWTGLNELRDKYLTFFEGKGHLRLDSFPLVPKNDPSLLLINSGMAPMKKWFLAQEEPPRHRVTTCQKCIRTPDIERVGITARHGTFFEMLGNFSFQDYFKEEVIPWAWEFLTSDEWMAIPKDKLHISVYEEDDEAYDIWTKKVGVAPDHMVRLGKEDNFWEHGSGPCGPCSEIYFDRGPEYGCGKPTCGVGCDCDRYMEIWNLVFSQFDADGKGHYERLARPNIDTGMGLERLACVMQGVGNLFEVDTVQSVLHHVEHIAGKTYGADAKDDISIRVITDHIRSCTFMVSDGILPSNEGRGYVLRRLLRRAARHGRMLGIDHPFLVDLVETVIQSSESAYPELREHDAYIKKVIGTEEANFARTIDAGMNILNNMIDGLEKAHQHLLSGLDVFKLNDTFGTAFWSQEYNSFEEIPLPNATITTHNPALRLEWERFCSEKLVDFIRFQADLLHELLPGAVVMHDFPGGGLTKHVSYADVAACLDQLAFNNYPVWGGQKEPLPSSEIAFGLDYIRGLQGKNFWITEAIMGAQGHDITGFLPRPNQAKLWSWQGMAHGCDGLMYFRYRGATKGAEQFCYGILDADNVPRRRFFEVQSFFREVREYQDVLTAPVHSDVAILYDYDSLASFRIQQQSLLLDCETEMKRLHGVFFRAGQSVDILPVDRDFSGYKIVVVPNMIVTDEAFALRLKRYVAAGGCAVVTYRTAVKDRNNNLTFGKVLPVDCSELLGLHIEETESVQEYDCIPLISDNGSGTAGIFRDMIVPDRAEVLYRYNDTFYQQYAAITRNELGEGRAYYLGTTPDAAILEQVLGEAMTWAGLTVEHLPEGVELVTRSSGERTVRFVLNHNENAVTARGLTLAPFEVQALS